MSADGRGPVSQAGAVLLWETIRATGLAWGLCAELARWRAVHDPGKVVADLAASVALGGDCLADIALPREQGEIAAVACELLAWTQLLARTGAARRWEPKRLRLRLLSVADRLARSGRCARLRLAQRWRWAADIPTATARLQAIPTG